MKELIVREHEREIHTTIEHKGGIVVPVYREYWKSTGYSLEQLRQWRKERGVGSKKSIKI